MTYSLPTVNGSSVRCAAARANSPDRIRCSASFPWIPARWPIFRRHCLADIALRL